MTQTPNLGTKHQAVVVAAPSSGANVRSAPTTSAPVVGNLKAGASISISQLSHTADGWVWYETDGGFVADTPGFDWEPKTPPTVPSPVPDALYVPLSVDEIQQLANLHTELARQHNAVATIYWTAFDRLQP